MNGVIRESKEVKVPMAQRVNRVKSEPKETKAQSDREGLKDQLEKRETWDRLVLRVRPEPLVRPEPEVRPVAEAPSGRKEKQDWPAKMDNREEEETPGRAETSDCRDYREKPVSPVSKVSKESADLPAAVAAPASSALRERKARLENKEMPENKDQSELSERGARWDPRENRENKENKDQKDQEETLSMKVEI